MTSAIKDNRSRGKVEDWISNKVDIWSIKKANLLHGKKISSLPDQRGLAGTSLPRRLETTPHPRRPAGKTGPGCGAGGADSGGEEIPGWLRLRSANIPALEAEIDRLVYALYGLSDEEITVVEGKK